MNITKNYNMDEWSKISQKLYESTQTQNVNTDDKNVDVEDVQTQEVK